MRKKVKAKEPVTLREIYRYFNTPKFKDMFAVAEDSGSFLYLTTACMDRHKNLTREEQSLPDTDGNYGNLEWSRERYNIACAHRLKNVFDIKPTGDLDIFISNNKHLLSDEMIERKDIFDRISEREKV